MSPAIRANALHHIYRPWPWSRRRPVLQGIELEVQKGDVHALLGSNGAGKSTFLRLVAGLFTPHRGTVEVFSQRPGSASVRARVSYLPEFTEAPTRLNVQEELRLYGSLYGLSGPALQQRMAEVLEVVGMSDHASRPIRRLSKGQRRRVAFAQSLLPATDLLLLDEPFNGVDAIWSEKLRAHLRTLRKLGRTVLFTSHLQDDVEAAANAVTVLDRGKIVATGSLNEVFCAQGDWRATWTQSGAVNEAALRDWLTESGASEVQCQPQHRKFVDLLRHPQPPSSQE